MFEQVVRQAKKKRVCFIDDGMDAPDCAWGKLFSLPGYTIEHFIDVKLAQTALNEQSYDLLIVDLNNVFDADSVISSVRQSQNLGKSVIPLIVVAEKQDEAHYNLLKAGADKVLIRPLEGHILVSAIAKLIPQSSECCDLENTVLDDKVVSINSNMVFVDRRKSRRVLSEEERAKLFLHESEEAVADQKSKIDSSINKTALDVSGKDKPKAHSEASMTQNTPSENMTNEDMDNPPLSMLDAIKQQMDIEASQVDRVQKKQSPISHVEIPEVETPKVETPGSIVSQPPLSHVKTPSSSKPQEQELQEQKPQEQKPQEQEVTEKTPDREPVLEAGDLFGNSPDVVAPVTEKIIEEIKPIGSNFDALERSETPIIEKIEPILTSQKVEEIAQEPEYFPKPEVSKISDSTPYDVFKQNVSLDDDIRVQPRFHPSKEKKKTKRSSFAASGKHFSSQGLMLFLFFALFVSVGNYLYFMEPSAVEVRVVSVDKAMISSEISASGRVTSKRSIEVSSRAEGQVAEIFVSEGDSVKKGQTLVRLDDTEARNNIKRADAKVRRSLAEVEAARKTYQRLKTAFDFGAVTRRIVEDSEAALTALQARHREIEEDLVRAKVKFDYLQIKSPFNGIVGAILTQEGQWLSPSDSALMLNDRDQRAVEFFLDEKYSVRLNIGQEVWVSSQDAVGHTWRESIVKIETDVSSALDGSTKEKVYLSFNGKLPIGNRVDVEFNVSSRGDAALVPYNVLFSHNNSPHVAVVENGRIHYRPVEIGIESDKRVEILKGLRASEQVIIPLGIYLEPGKKVEVIQ